MISVSDLTKHYGPTRSLDGVSFSVEKGEVLGFLGPNGAGKSTTMRLLVGLARPTRGTAKVGGLDVQEQQREVHRLLGYLPEGAPLYPDMTLSRYLEFMAGMKGLDAREAKREADRTSALVNLQKERNRLLRNLSKGTRQRAAIAQALLGDPEVLILDEPTVGLDPSQINDVRQLVKSMRGQRTVILSTHILPEVELTCSRIVIIAAGRIVANGTAEELINARAASFAIVARGDDRKFRSVLSRHASDAKIEKSSTMLTAQFPTAPAEEKRGQIARELVEAGIDLIEFRADRPRLEDVFLDAVARRSDA